MLRQRLPYFIGISGQIVGASGLSMHFVRSTDSFGDVRAPTLPVLPGFNLTRMPCCTAFLPADILTFDGR
jgi:hypothetical protein